ncbi:MAG: hypothetical protein ACP5SH_17355 [Syntrophobacteraceae bacterium]
MKATMIVLLALAMAFALIPAGVAGIGSANAQGYHYATVAPPLHATCQGAFAFGPATPAPMGSVGGASGG